MTTLPAPDAPVNAERCPMRQDYDPFSPEAMTDPTTALAAVVRETPVFFNPHSQWWTVGGYDEVLDVLADTARFSSAGVAMGDLAVPDEARELAPAGNPTVHPSLVNSDPPAHRRVRRVANKAFTPPVIATWAPTVEQLVTRLLDGIVDAGRCEFAASFADPLPRFVIAKILGIADEDLQLAASWPDDFLNVQTTHLPHDAIVEAWRRIGQATTYLNEMIASRRRMPRDDLITKLIEATDGDHQLDDKELLSLITQLLIASHGTTKLALTSTVLRLAEDADLAQRLRGADDELLTTAIEELLRHSGPAGGLFRVATEDVELGEAVIRKGDMVEVCYAVANRDERMFERPDEFLIERENLGRHIAFGRGEHFCIGSPLARLELKIATREILARMPNLRRADDGPLEWSPSVLTAGPERLEICWDTIR